mgnify:CR=1 FL=1
MKKKIKVLERKKDTARREKKNTGIGFCKSCKRSFRRPLDWQTDEGNDWEFCEDHRYLCGIPLSAWREAVNQLSRDDNPGNNAVLTDPDKGRV